MTKYRMLAALLAGLILMSLAGCAAGTDTADGIPDPQSQKIIAADDSSSERMTGSTPEVESAKNSPSPAATVKPAEKESSASQGSESPGTESPVSSAPLKNKADEASKPSPTENPARTEKPKIEESKPTAPPSATPAPSPKPTEPTATPTPTEPPVPPAATPEPEPSEPELVEQEPTEPPAPAFDIDYWVSYAQNYAADIGLRLESSAVDCWDNPITAGAHSACLERDIGSRLNRYSRDEDITDVWIWAEPRADGSYDLFIGYA